MKGTWLRAAASGGCPRAGNNQAGAGVLYSRDVPHHVPHHVPDSARITSRIDTLAKILAA